MNSLCEFSINEINIIIHFKWHTQFHDIDIKYIQDVPNDEEWNMIKPNSLVTLDDLFVEAVNSESCSKAFKVYARKRNFSIVVVSQVSHVRLKVFLFMKIKTCS